MEDQNPNNPNNQMTLTEGGSKKRRSWPLVAAIILLLLIGWFWWRSRQAMAPVLEEPALEASGPNLSGEDTTTAIEEELNATDLGDIETEFQGIEEELKNL